ncbi:hypothetical protein [Nonomuraea sp. NPDC052265]|uniref:hypothetical protein n=1 Tax=Nonomuraea sp. NPDC052265 TaxID=3364374 RepID=UPI0037CB7B14
MPDGGGVPAALASFARAAAREAARLRHGRALHRRGLLVAGTLTVEAAPLGEPGEHEVRARLSKGLSLPGRLPDVLGLAVRLPNGVDLLLSTGAGGLPVPRRTFMSGPYSSLTPYVYGTGLYRLVARPEGERVPADPELLPGALARGPLLFHLWAGGRYLARLRVHTALPGEDLTFDPVLNSRPCLRPAGWTARLRRAAYEGSREGRGAPPPWTDP